AATTLGHDQHVGVAERRIKGGKRNELPIRSLQKKQGRPRRSPPRGFDWKKVGCVAAKHVVVASLGLAHSGQRAEEQASLGQCFHYCLRAVHACDRINKLLPPIRNQRLGLFEFLLAKGGLRSACTNHEAEPGGLDGTGNDFLLHFEELRFCDLRLYIDAE